MPKHEKRLNSPFTNEESTWTILEYGALRNVTAVRRKFRGHFKKQKDSVPSHTAFKRLIDRFHESGDTTPAKSSGGRPQCPEEQVDKVRQFVKPYQDRSESISIPAISKALDIPPTTVWRIMRKRLGWKPYKPHITVPLTAAHRAGRVKFCEWLLQQPVGFEERVIWTDEKWFCLTSTPNKQNERYWAPLNPRVTVACKEQGGQKVMCWAAVTDGRVLIHWHDPGTSVNGEAYLNLLVQGLWPELRDSVKKQKLWFQQDGATVHTTRAVRAWLDEAFSGRVISRLTDRPWPARSPDLSPLDYWFWSVALTELRRNPPSCLEELKMVVEAFAGSLEPEEVRRAVRHLRQRAETCVSRKGDTVESP